MCLDVLCMVEIMVELPFLCPREVNHFQRSWDNHERCTAILVGSSMLLSVEMPHSGRDEEEYIEALETVGNIVTEGGMAEAVDFYIGGDINIEMKRGTTGEDLQGLDSIEWYGVCGPECRGGGVDARAKVAQLEAKFPTEDQRKRTKICAEGRQNGEQECFAQRM